MVSGVEDLAVSWLSGFIGMNKCEKDLSPPARFRKIAAAYPGSQRG